MDILLLAGLSNLEGTLLSRAIVSTFDLRDTHSVPRAMPSFSRTIRREYTRMADEVGLVYKDFDTAENALAGFINPVLQCENPGMWDSETWQWCLE